MENGKLFRTTLSLSIIFPFIVISDCQSRRSVKKPKNNLKADEGLTLKTSAIHQTSQAKIIPYQPC